MYKFLDLDLNEIPFPEGVIPLDVFVGSISKRRTLESIPGRHGQLNYGADYDQRPVNVTMLADGADREDYRLIRNAVYELLDRYDEFYLMETDVASRVLKVCVNESFMPNRLTITAAEFDVQLQTLDIPFWESIYTTVELHDSGFSSTPEKYGLVDNIDTNKLQYRFELQNPFNPNLIPLNPGDWENGSRWSGGANNNASAHVRLKMDNYIPLVVGRQYTLQDNSTFNSRMNFIQIHIFDDNENMVQYFSRSRRGNLTFTAQGTRLVISINALDTFAIPLDYIGGDRIQLKLEEGNTYTGMKPEPETFTVYNAGNVTIEPESMMLDIITNGVHTDGGFTIKNVTTGETFVFESTMTGQSLILRGINILVSASVNRLRDTNKQFISLAPGDNEFEISGGSYTAIRFDFKYLYK